MIGPLVVDEVEVLQDRVGRAEEPALAQPLLRGDRRHVVVEQVGQPPRLGDVPVQAVRLVLRQHRHLEEAGVDEAGQGEVDEAVDPAERHRRLGPVGGERHQPLALTAGEHDAEHPRPGAPLEPGAHGTARESVMAVLPQQVRGRGSPILPR